MKRDAVLINTSRGSIVDQVALVKALERRQIAGAYLDVFEEEPLPATDPLWALEIVIITPHVADSVSDWSERFAALFSENLERWLAGRPLLNLLHD